MSVSKIIKSGDGIYPASPIFSLLTIVKELDMY